MKYFTNAKRIMEAVEFAKRAHKGQKRKVSGEDYYFHPIAVAFLVMTFKRSKKLTDLVVAAILHDVLEDTEVTFLELAVKFGPFVASLVLELTNDNDEIARIGKTAYMKKKLVNMSGYALLLKLCDRLNNMTDAPTEKMKKETIQIINHLLRYRKNLTHVHRALAKEILAVCKA